MKKKWDVVSPEDACAIFNRALMADPKAVTMFVQARFECNKELAEDPTIQTAGEVGKRLGEEPAYRVGGLGLLNGLFGIDRHGWGAIVADLNTETGLITEFFVRERDSDPMKPRGEEEDVESD